MNEVWLGTHQATSQKANKIPIKIEAVTQLLMLPAPVKRKADRDIHY